MHQKAADELLVFQGDIALFAGFVILCREGDMGLVYRADAAVSNSNPVGVASQVFDGISGAIEGFFDVGTPFLPVKAIPEFVPCMVASQFFARRRECEPVECIKVLNTGEKFPSEFGSHDLDGEIEFAAAQIQLKVLRQSASRDNAVDMGVKIELLSPGMENLDDAGRCAEILPVI